jgi:hypothetical protein
VKSFRGLVMGLLSTSVILGGCNDGPSGAKAGSSRDEDSSTRYSVGSADKRGKIAYAGKRGGAFDIYVVNETDRARGA